MAEEDKLNDESLLHALAEGAIWPLERLYHRYSDLLYTLAYRMVSDHQLAEEVVQDTFVSVWKHAPSYTTDSGSVRTWLIALTRHRAIDHLRRVQRRPSSQELPWEAAKWEAAAILPDVWENAWRAEQRAQIREALLNLPSEQSLVITLAFFLGWTHSEIALRCDLPFGTVKARIRLGLHHLKQALEQSGIVEMVASGATNRRAAKPKQAAMVVVQATGSDCTTEYELCHGGSCQCFGYTEWVPLVEKISAFEFSGTEGNFSARKAKRANDRSYWYAFRWGESGKKTYLGTAAELTLPNLEAMARKLHMG